MKCDICGVETITTVQTKEGIICINCYQSQFEYIESACRPGAHQSMFEEILEKLNKHDLEIGALFTAKDGASAQRDELLERLKKVERHNSPLLNFRSEYFGDQGDHQFLAKLSKEVDSNTQAILASPTSDYVDQHLRAHEAVLHRIAKELSNELDDTGQLYDVLMQEINCPQPEPDNIEAKAILGPILPNTPCEPDLEQLAEYAREEYAAGIGLAHGDQQTWDELSEKFREGWRYMVRSLLEELERL